MLIVPHMLLDPRDYHSQSQHSLILILTLVNLNPPVSREVASTRSLKVTIDADGFLNLDKLQDINGRKINLRKDAMFEFLDSITQLQSKYMLEIKLVKKHSYLNEDSQNIHPPDIENIVMLRYVVFSTFLQQMYPLIYMTILRRVIGSTLANSELTIDNKLSMKKDISVRVKDDMFTEDQVIEMDNLYQRLQDHHHRVIDFPLIVRRHSKLINEVLPKSGFSDFIEQSFVVNN